MKHQTKSKTYLGAGTNAEAEAIAARTRIVLYMVENVLILGVVVGDKKWLIVAAEIYHTYFVRVHLRMNG